MPFAWVSPAVLPPQKTAPNIRCLKTQDIGSGFVLFVFIGQVREPRFSEKGAFSLELAANQLNEYRPPFSF